MYDSIHDGTRDVCFNLFKDVSTEDIPNPVLEMVEMYKQHQHECGIFEIAVATSLLHKCHSFTRIDEQLMRSHLLSCIENQKLTKFSFLLVPFYHLLSLTTIIIG